MGRTKLPLMSTILYRSRRSGGPTDKTPKFEVHYSNLKGYLFD